MRSTSVARALVLCAVVPLGAALLDGCVGDDSPAADRSAAAAASATGSGAHSTAGARSGDDSARAGRTRDGSATRHRHRAHPARTVQPALAALDDWACDAGHDGVWTASGTVTNHSADPARYRVVVSVVSDGTTAVGGWQRTWPEIPAGATRRFRFGHVYSGATPDLSCIAQVVRMG